MADIFKLIDEIDEINGGETMYENFFENDISIKYFENMEKITSALREYNKSDGTMNFCDFYNSLRAMIKVYYAYKGDKCVYPRFNIGHRDCEKYGWCDENGDCDPMDEEGERIGLTFSGPRNTLDKFLELVNKTYKGLEIKVMDYEDIRVTLKDEDPSRSKLRDNEDNEDE